MKNYFLKTIKTINEKIFPNLELVFFKNRLFNCYKKKKDFVENF